MKFVTGNREKFKEMKQFIPELEQWNIDLPEIQGLDAQEIIAAKIKEAQKYIEPGTEIIVEDTSLYINEMNGLPGPLIKWFLDSIGVEGIWRIAKNLDSQKAYAKAIIGYSDKNSNIYFFEGIMYGKIVEPRDVGFGWNPIFQSDKSNKNSTEMSLQEKSLNSMRAEAALKLKQYLSHF